jgi:hypothetical protein
MPKPKRPYKSLEEFRRDKLEVPRIGWPCLECGGNGKNFVVGFFASACPTCKGSGKGTKKAVQEAYRQEIQAWKEEVQAYYKEIETVRRAIAKLTEREFRALADYLTEEP